jgi:hypothetical protein
LITGLVDSKRVAVVGQGYDVSQTTTGIVLGQHLPRREVDHRNAAALPVGYEQATLTVYQGNGHRSTDAGRQCLLICSFRGSISTGCRPFWKENQAREAPEQDHGSSVHRLHVALVCCFD